MKKIGIVFGVFDGLHEGHTYFLDKASSHCNELVVVVTQTEIVRLLKSKMPRYSFEERCRAITQFNPHVHVVHGDTTLGAWSVFTSYSDFVVLLGYDQHGIAKELDKCNIAYIFLPAHHPEKYKSSLLHADI